MGSRFRVLGLRLFRVSAYGLRYRFRKRATGRIQPDISIHNCLFLKKEIYVYIYIYIYTHTHSLSLSLLLSLWCYRIPKPQALNPNCPCCSNLEGIVERPGCGLRCRPGTSKGLGALVGV